MKYLCHYHFIGVTTFDFFGDSIVEGANCVLRRGDVTIPTNMNIDAMLTQIQISKHRLKKSTSIYCVISLAIMV